MRAKTPVRSGSSAAVGSSPSSSAQVRLIAASLRSAVDRVWLKPSQRYAAACSRCGSRRDTTWDTPSGPIVTP